MFKLGGVKKRVLVISSISITEVNELGKTYSIENLTSILSTFE